MEETKPEPRRKGRSPHPRHLPGADAVAGAAHQVGQAAHRAATVGHRVGRRIRRFLAGLGISTLGAVLLCVLAIVLVLRFYGLPPQAKRYLLRELEARGVTASVDRLLLSPSGDVIAERVSVFRTPERQALLLQVDHVRLGIGWFSWWRGQPFLRDAEVRNAAINLPLTDKSTVALRQVNAQVEFTGGGLTVRSASARVLNLLLELRGAVLLNGPLPARKADGDPQARAATDALCRRIVAVCDDLDTQHPIRVQVEFGVATAHPEDATARVAVAARYVRWRGVLIDEVAAEATLANHVATLSDFHVRLDRGELDVTAEADLAKKRAGVEFSSTLDFTPLAAAFPGHVGDALAKLVFTELPSLSGRADLGWADGFTANLQADLDWEDFRYGDAAFDRLLIPVSYDGKRLFVPGLELAARNGKGACKADLLYDPTDPAKPAVRAKIDSTLDITALDGVGGPGLDRFLESLHFDGAGPAASLVVSGASLHPQDLVVKGHVKSGPLSYKKIPFDAIEADVVFQNMGIDVRNLAAKRKEGSVTGGLRDDFALRRVRIDKIRSDVNVQEIAPVLGDKFAGYVAPYKFDKAPKVVVDGLVDLDDTKSKLDTDLSVGVDSGDGGTLHYVIYNIPLPVDRPKADLHIVDRTLTLRLAEGQLYGGKLTGNLKVQLDPKHEGLDASLQVAGGDFKKAMVAVYKNDQSSGTFDLQLNLAGIVGDLSTFQGDGGLSVDNGYIMSIPILSSLSAVVDSVIPGFIGKADHGKATFKIGNGVLRTDDLTISSAIMSLIGNGSIDFVKGTLDMDMRVNVKGLPGLLLFPVSKLLEYHGGGTLEKPVWKPKNI